MSLVKRGEDKNIESLIEVYLNNNVHFEDRKPVIQRQMPCNSCVGKQVTGSLRIESKWFNPKDEKN